MLANISDDCPILTQHLKLLISGKGKKTIHKKVYEKGKGKNAHYNIQKPGSQKLTTNYHQTTLPRPPDQQRENPSTSPALLHEGGRRKRCSVLGGGRGGKALQCLGRGWGLIARRDRRGNHGKGRGEGEFLKHAQLP